MNKDVNSLQFDGENYSFVLNGTTESYSEEQAFPFISNTSSNVKCFAMPQGYALVGVKNIQEFNKTLLALYSETDGISKIIELTYSKLSLGLGDVEEKNCSTYIVEQEEDLTTPRCTSRELISTECFTWNTASPVRFEYKITDCTLNLYFANGLDEDRNIQFDYDLDYNLTLNEGYKQKATGFEACNPIYLESLDCNSSLFNQEASLPCIEESIIPGGSLASGKYSFVLAYSTSKGIPLSSFKSITEGIDIFALGKATSNLGIKLKLSNLEQNSRYTHFTIAAIETIAGITTIKQKGTYSISQTEIIILDNAGVSIPLQQILTQYPYYKNSSDLTISNDILFRAGLNEYEKFNLQPVANKIKLKWFTKVKREGETVHTFMRDEVYAFAINFILSNGEAIPSFPLIGRSADSFDTALVSSCSSGNVPRWKEKNTAAVSYTSTDTLEQLYASGKIYQTGEFGYIESEAKYPFIPEVWGDLCGEPIRHFKFPDTAISPHMNDNSSYDSLNYIIPLGISVESDIAMLLDEATSEGLITQEQRERIVGYKLLRSNRAGNKTVIAKGLLYDVWSYKKKEVDTNFLNTCETISETYYYPNYPFNDLREDKLLANTSKDYYDNNVTQSVFRFELFTSFTSAEEACLQISPKVTYYSNTSSLSVGSWLTLDSELTQPVVIGFHSDGYNTYIAELGVITEIISCGDFEIPEVSPYQQFSGTSRYTFHSADTHFTQPALGTRLKLEAEMYGDAKGFFNVAQEQAKYKLLNEKHYNFSITIGKWIASKLKDPTTELLRDAGNSLGSTVGETIGGIVALPKLGKTLGGLVGGLLGANLSASGGTMFSFAKDVYKNSIALSEAEKFLEIITLLSNYRDYQYQYQAVGKYNRLKTPPSVPVKAIKHSAYLTPDRTYLSDGTFFNNNDRESSVYLALDSDCSSFPSPSIVDTSRVKISDNASSTSETVIISSDPLPCRSYTIRATQGRFELWSIACDEAQTATKIADENSQCFFCSDFDIDITVPCAARIEVRENKGSLTLGNLTITEGAECGEVVTTQEVKVEHACDCNKPVVSTVSSYYGSIKQENLSQYGTIYDIDWIEIPSCVLGLSKTNKPFYKPKYLKTFNTI